MGIVKPFFGNPSTGTTFCEELNIDTDPDWRDSAPASASRTGHANAAIRCSTMPSRVSATVATPPQQVPLWFHP